MLNTQEALEAARKYLNEVFPDFVHNDLRLEELESPLSGGRWRFTFSSATAGEVGSSSSLLDALRPRRTQKLVELDADSGMLVAVKNKAA
jgi:hypothetical protein